MSGSEGPVREILTPEPAPTQRNSPQPSGTEPEIEEETRTPRPEEEARSHENLQASIEEIWYLKEISFRPVPEAAPRMYKIITQNFNGAALTQGWAGVCCKGNILILREKIQILPYDRPTVSYEHLSHLVAEYLLTSCPDVDISAALSVMPATRKGMDLNPLFTGATSFRPAGAAGGELKLFEQAGIQLAHGWLVDPSAPEYAVVARLGDYDSAVNLLVEVDYLTKGQFVVAEDPEPGPSSAGPSSAGSSSSGAQAGSSSARTYNLTPEQQQKVEDALIVRSFIESTSSQLTYYGLFELASSLPPTSLVALFRNSHLSVLYKAPGEHGALYTLVTDQVFLHEPAVVWERLEDVDGGWSTFVDAEFVRSSPAGGDYAGHTAESALHALEREAAGLTLDEHGRADEQLARQLQAAEEQRMNDFYARQELDRADRLRQQQEREAARNGRNGRANGREDGARSKKKDCIVM
uniref:Lipase_3 domain-containing protein n=1 Tax=Ganoderma boninense TaxID=34458 RepID=A0A5K1K4G1_9APHY|nr:Lipase_3 domain-containing protein [Ganoderma boninense]